MSRIGSALDYLDAPAIRADITTLAVDAVMNAAILSLLGGGGADTAIHRAAGPDLLREDSLLADRNTGDTKLANGQLMPARHVTHTIGPVWRGGDEVEPEQLASCYGRGMEIAKALTN